VGGGGAVAASLQTSVVLARAVAVVAWVTAAGVSAAVEEGGQSSLAPALARVGYHGP